jgi:hypothetical protein
VFRLLQHPIVVLLLEFVQAKLGILFSFVSHPLDGYIHLRTVYQGIFFHATRVSSVTSGSQRILSHPLGHVNLIPNFKVRDGHKGNAALRQGVRCNGSNHGINRSQSALDGIETIRRFAARWLDRLTQNYCVSSFDV